MQWRLFVVYVVTSSFVEHGAGQSSDSEPIFIKQPKTLDQCALESGMVISLQWVIQYEKCSKHRINIETKNNINLHPPDSVVPIEVNRDYNVTVNYNDCRSERNITRINITLWIHLNDDVFQHVPYIMCTLFGLGDDGTQIHLHSEKVFIQVNSDINCPVSTETTVNATTTYTTNASYSMQYRTYQNSILFALLCLILMFEYYT